MTGPTIADAIRSLNERKYAAGLDRTNPDARGATSKMLGIFAGTDLTAEEVLGYAYAQAERALPVYLANGVGYGAATTWQDGLLTGLELARLRRREENIDARVTALRHGLEQAARILTDRHDRLGYARPERADAALDVIRTILTGDEEDTHG